KANITYGDLFKRLWPYCRKHLGLFASVIFCVAGLAISSRSLPFLIGYAIDNGIRNHDYQALKNIALIYLAVQVLQTTFQFSYNYIFQIFGNRVLFYVREDLIKHIQSLPIQYF